VESERLRRQRRREREREKDGEKRGHPQQFSFIFCMPILLQLPVYLGRAEDGADLTTFPVMRITIY
jgi:hypothetical protein